MAVSGDCNELVLDCKYEDITKLSDATLNDIIDCGRYGRQDVLTCRHILLERKFNIIVEHFMQK